jgi:hypothetical protein
MPAPRFAITDWPGDIVDRSGQWLAEQLGWRWVKNRRDVEVRAGRQVRRLGLQSSTWNRAGVATRASTRVIVLDPALRTWREAHPASTVLPVSAYAAWPHVYNALLINVDLDLAQVECSGLPQRFPALRAMRLDEFAAAFRERVLPVLELFQSPSLVARELPASMMTGTLRRCCCVGTWKRPLEGQQRWEQRLASFRRGWAIAPGRDGLPSSAVLVCDTESLGWLAQVHDLIDQETLRQPAQHTSAAERLIAARTR